MFFVIYFNQEEINKKETSDSIDCFFIRENKYK